MPEWAAWEVRERQQKRQAEIDERRRLIQEKMEESERLQKEQDEDERLSKEEKGTGTDKTTVSKIRNYVSRWFGVSANESENEKEGESEVEDRGNDSDRADEARSAEFTIPKGTRKVVVTIKRKDGTQTSYTITNYISMYPGDTLHLRSY